MTTPDSWGGGAEPPRNAPPMALDPPENRENRRWADAPLPTPAPSERESAPGGTDPVAAGLALMDAHAAVVSVLVGRSPADFRPIPSWVAERAAEVRAAFAPSERMRPSLVAELAPLVAPRLERIVDHLRRRLGRERQMLALPRLREMDPACVRRNARLPGTTLVEKAGPRQKVLGVRRIPRFDTMENRVLVATARLLAARATHELRRPSEPGDRRARELRRLVRAAAEVLGRPELVGVGSPRPGERPSNALVGDADYRAVWRAGQLVQREEERFQEEWAALPGLWLELVLLAAWAAMDGAGDAVPTWVRVGDGRVAGLRVETGGSRRWIDMRGDTAIVTTVEPDPADASVRIRRVITGPEDERLEEARVSAALWVGSGEGGDEAVLGASATAPSLGRATHLVAIALGQPAAHGEHSESQGPPRTSQFLGVCALDARVVVADGTGAWQAGAAAVATVVVPGEAPMEASGHPATWFPNVGGPQAIFSNRAEEGGALISAFRGLRETAVVVPDSLDELGVRRLRTRLGRAWFVWSPVAAALAAAEEHPEHFPPASSPRHVLVVVATDATLDVAVLEDTVDPAPPAKRRAGRLWVRSTPRGGGAEGREASRFGEADASRGAWLRDPAAAEGWALDGDRARRVVIPQESSSVERILARAARWTGPKPTLVVTVGLSGAESAALSQRLGVTSVPLDASALARGAHVFLERHHAGLATWKDRLPKLTFEVKAGRLHESVTLVDKDTLIAPGDTVDLSPKKAFRLAANASSVRFPLSRDDQPGGCAILLDGAAFPLKQPVEVRIVLRYTYGLQGMEGAVEPFGSASFVRVPFRIDVADAAATPEPRALNLPPPSRSRGALDERAERNLRESVRALDELIGKIPQAVLREAQKQPGKLGPELTSRLRGAVRELAEAAKVQGGAGPTPGALRRFLEEKAAPLLDSLLELKAPGRSKPPLLGGEERRAVARARAELAVRGSGEFSRWLVGELTSPESRTPAGDALQFLGRVVDGDRTVFRTLAEFVTVEPAQHGRWAAALRDALDAHPTLLACVDAAALLARTIKQLHAVAALPNPERFKDAGRDCADLVPRLCHARPSALAPDDPVVLDAIAQLGVIRDALPDAVRKHGGRASAMAESEPVAVAINYLRGNYDDLPELR